MSKSAANQSLALGTPADRLRSEIPIKYKWDIAALFKSDAEWRAAFDKIEQGIPDLENAVNHLLDTATALEQGLAAIFSTSDSFGKLKVYADLALATDTRDSVAQERLGIAQALGLRVSAATATYPVALAKMPSAQWQQFLAERPTLTIYQNMITRSQREQEHALSNEAAQILAIAGQALDVPETTYSALTSADLSFQSINAAGAAFTPTQGNMDALLSHPDRELRRKAWESYADGYKSHENTLTQTYVGSVRTESFMTRLRKFPTSIEKKLFWDDLPNEAFYGTLQSFTENLPIWHRYWRVRAKVLGVTKMTPYDVHAPLTNNAPEVSYDEAVSIISQAVAVMGEEYAAPIRAGLTTERWVDPFANKAKRGNAFSSGTYQTKPYILMNYNNSLSDVSTLAHELGHSIHSYLTNQNQQIQDSGYSLFLAEIASNFCQVIVRHEIFKRASSADQKRAALDEAFYNLHRYLFTMPLLSQFEDRVHKADMSGEGISAEYLSETMNKLLATAYGSHVELDQPRAGTMWAQYGHLYMSFYTFTYITGISIAHFYGNRVVAGDKTAAQQFLNVLRGGAAKFPLDLLRENGLDLLRDKPVDAAFKTLDGYIDQLEALL